MVVTGSRGQSGNVQTLNLRLARQRQDHYSCSPGLVMRRPWDHGNGPSQGQSGDCRSRRWRIPFGHECRPRISAGSPPPIKAQGKNAGSSPYRIGLDSQPKAYHW